MNTRTTKPGTDETDSGAGKLERVAQTLHPPSREISDEEILDPGASAPRESREEPGRDKPVEGGRR